MQNNYSVTLPHFSVGPEAYTLIPDVLKPYGKRVAIIGGKTALAKSRDALLAGLKAAGAEVLVEHVYGENATVANIERAKALPEVQAADVVFCVGGGRAIDCAKTVADQLDKPWFSVPTVASNCAPVSAVAVLYNDNGSLYGYHFTKSCPEHTFINTTVIINSPEELFWAGIGDALSKQIEVLFASEGKKLFHSTYMGRALCLACQDPLLNGGRQAMEDFRAKKLTEAFTECVLDIIVTTGTVSNLMTNKNYYFNSSLAHCFYNASMVLPMGHKHLHGEIVSFGNLVLLAYSQQTELLARYLQFNADLDLPTTLDDLDISPEELEVLLDKAQEIKEWTCVPYPTTREAYYEAIMAVDRAGKALKAGA